MTDDVEKSRVKPFVGTGDYILFKTKIKLACQAKGLSNALICEQNPGKEETNVDFKAEQLRVSNIIFNCITNDPPRIVCMDTDNPFHMMRKLEQRYDSHSSTSLISKMTALVSVKYKSVKVDLGKHVDKMATLMEQIRNMNTVIEEKLAAAFLIASIGAQELLPTAVEIRTLSNEIVTWVDVSDRLIEEYRNVRIHSHPQRAAAGISKRLCDICNKPGHSIAKCWLNPRNPNNRLRLGEEGKKMIKQAIGDGDAENPGKELHKKEHRVKQRTAVARAMMANIENDALMLDSGTNSHMTPKLECLHGVDECNIALHLDDDLKIKATHTGFCNVKWNGQDGATAVNLNIVLYSPNMAMILLSIPALASKNIHTLFTRDMAKIMDADDGYCVLGIAPRGKDGLYYIQSNGNDARELSIYSEDVKAFVSIVAAAIRNTEDESENTSDTEENEIDSNYSVGEDDCSDEDESYECSQSATSPRNIQKMMSDNTLQKPKRDSVRDSVDCDPCKNGKYRRQFRGTVAKGVKAGSLHADLVGPIKPKLRGGDKNS